MKKFFLFFIPFCVFLILALILGRNFLAKQLVISGIASLTGLKAEVKAVEIGIFKTTASVKGLKVFNPSGFQDPLMLDLPEVYVDYDLGGFFQNKIHFRRLRIDLREFSVITEKKGRSNVASLSVLKPAAKGKAPQLRIDLFELKLGKIVYKNYNTGVVSLPAREIVFNLEAKVSNITNPEQLLNFILTQSFKNRDISGLIDLPAINLVK